MPSMSFHDVLIRHLLMCTGPEHLLLVFGITLVSDFFMLATLLFITLLYVRNRRGFLAADRKRELPVEYSDYIDRERPARPLDQVERGKGIGRGKGKGRKSKSRASRQASSPHDRL